MKLAQATFRDTDVDLVVVGLPQSRTRHLLLVFERDLLGEDLDPLAATAQRLYAMGGLVPHSETRGQPPARQATTVSRRTSGSVKTSRSSRLVDENSEITAPSGPAVKECKVSGGIVNCSPGRRTSSRPSTRRVDEPAAAAERLLLAGRAVERRMPVLGARLARVEDELLGAVAVGVDVHEHDQALLAKSREPEVGDLDLVALGVGEHDSARLELGHRVGLRCALLVARDHAVSTLIGPSPSAPAS